MKPNVDIDSKQVFKHGFVHVVYFWLKPGQSDTEVAEFEAELRKMLEDSEHASTGHVGKPAGTPREVVDNSYDYCLLVTFDDAASHEAYQQEPPHDRFRKINKRFTERVQIYDSMG